MWFKRIIGSFRDSAEEFRKLPVIVFCGMMGALSIVLGTFASISVGPTIKIGFSAIPNIIVDAFFGPAVGGVFGALMNTLKYMIRPDGAFFPGFTVSAAVAAVIYGLILYKKKLTLVRFFFSQFLVKLVVNVGLNTLWLNMLYGKAFSVILPARIVSNLIQLPVDTIVYFILLKAVYQVLLPRVRTMGQGGHVKKTSKNRQL
jgi:ECF transporter S component (folate family)